MQLTIEQPKLAALLSRVTGVIEKRNTIPVLSNVVMVTKDANTVIVRGTDLNSDAIATGEAEVSEYGECTVRAEMLQGIVNRLAKGSLVTLSHNGDKLTVSSGKSSFNLATLPVDDFPDASEDNYTTEIELPSHELARLHCNALRILNRFRPPHQ